MLSPGNFSTIGELAEGVVDDYYVARDTPGLRGVTLGYDRLDEVTLGAQGGDLVVVAGRTGMGKSWLLVKMAYEAWRAGYDVGLASMEMTLLPISRRWFGLHTGINPNLIRAGSLSAEAEQRMVQQLEDVRHSPAGGRAYFLSGDFQKKVSQMERMFDEFGVDALYIDAAYLLTPEGRARGAISRWEQIATVISELKQIALRHNKPIIISVQMNRNVKKATNRSLDTTDIGGSDSIPQDSSIILGLRQGQSPYETVRRSIDLLKNRDGEEVTMDINYRFSPVNLDEAPPVTEAESSEINLDWM